MNGIRLQIANKVENCSIQVSHNTDSNAEVNSLSNQCLDDKFTRIHRESSTENEAFGENVAEKTSIQSTNDNVGKQCEVVADASTFLAACCETVDIGTALA